MAMLRNLVDALSGSPRSQSPVRHAEILHDPQSDTPFTKFVLSRLDEDSAKMFAVSFAENIRNDPDEKNLCLDDVFVWLGFSRKGKAIELLKREFEDQDVIHRSVKNTSVGRPVDQYLISINQFEHLLLTAKTDAGRTARKTVLMIKRAAFDYMKIELQEKSIRMQSAIDAQASLQRQLDNIRLSKNVLYAFWMHSNHFKCGLTEDVTQRERTFKTANPSGKMVHIVRINSKYIEKVFDSSMKSHARHVAGEEYVFPGGESEVAMILNTFARCDEALHILPLDKFSNLLAHVDSALAYIDADKTPDDVCPPIHSAIGIPVSEALSGTVLQNNEEINDSAAEVEGESQMPIPQNDLDDDDDVSARPASSNSEEESQAQRFFSFNTYERFYS